MLQSQEIRQPLPEELCSILTEHHREAVGPDVCAECSSVCCIQGGFAILENIIQIHDIYEQGRLVRDDYEFLPDLELRAFASLYFDFHFIPTKSEGKLVLYRTKHLTQNSKLLSSQPHGAAPNDEQPDEADHCRSQGCVFLNKSMADWPTDDKEQCRGCIVHDKDCMTHLTAKPIHCVFYTCAMRHEQKVADAHASHEWIEGIAATYPGSEDRFHRMMEGESTTSLRV